MYLDELPILLSEVGYGGLGLGGSLGYEERRARAGGREYGRALGTHPPARLVFELGGRYTTLRTDVAIADGVPAGRSDATFVVLADGRQVARADRVVAGQPPRTLVADLRGASTLELVVRTTRFPFAHAIWLDPVIEEADGAAAMPVVDCLDRAEIVPLGIPAVERCIATVVSPGFERRLDDMLGSLCANGGCAGALLAILAVDPNAECERLAARYGAVLVRCRARGPVDMAVKAVLYSVAHVVPARRFLCMDADVLVTGDLSPVFAAIDALPPDRILACMDGNRDKYGNVGRALVEMYGGRATDAGRLGITPAEASFPLVANDGVFAGSREALLALDATIRAMPHAIAWMRDTDSVWWRNQFVFNLALARLGTGVELDGSYNVQLQEQAVEFLDPRLPAPAEWNGQPARVLHFNGSAKRVHVDRQGHYAAVARPMIGATPGDGYREFLDALRRWAGARGLHALAYSFYGTADGQMADVRDVSVLPLFAALHYLVRANGCVRVVECGTARGVSAALLASAVAARQGGRVVTFDPFPDPERQALWRALPASMQAAIDARATGSIEGMTAALAAGERFDAALLDSVHTAEHVWAELELARQLVCPGGLLLVHDPTWVHGTVEGALRRLEREGYGVVRLWTADSGVPEDDRLGLAVIENRRRVDR